MKSKRKARRARTRRAEGNQVQLDYRLSRLDRRPPSTRRRTELGRSAMSAAVRASWRKRKAVAEDAAAAQSCGRLSGGILGSQRALSLLIDVAADAIDQLEVAR